MNYFVIMGICVIQSNDTISIQCFNTNEVVELNVSSLREHLSKIPLINKKIIVKGHISNALSCDRVVVVG